LQQTKAFPASEPTATSKTMPQAHKLRSLAQHFGQSATPNSVQEGGAEGVHRSFSPPSGPVATKDVGSFRVAVATDDVQLLAAHEGEHLTKRRLSYASPTDEEYGLLVLQAPAEEQGFFETSQTTRKISP
jgi:hypothetical protein